MPALDEIDELRHQGYTDVDFHVVDPNKRSRFQGKDLCTLIRDEWQQVADALNQATTASFSFRACRDKVAVLLKDNKRSSANIYLRLLSSMKRRKEEHRRFLSSDSSSGSGQDDEERECQTFIEAEARAGQAASQDDEQSQLRRFLGKCSEIDGSEIENDGQEYAFDDAYGSNEENSSVDKDVSTEDSVAANPSRTRLHVSEIWAKEEAMLKKERAAQAARDNALQNIVETWVIQNKLILEHFMSARNNSNNQA
ncbi:hypothetical protein PHMEG_00022899 [Phytophthora megakarya]|uniref:Uncharacterized protein n=1 Tax=Phytophthora megakarya TaxID=4795 RepID=A0A225VJA0_9STRA|nr:hypothetical protein PHMEG_00022899 [Phytophthora megakarya]